MAERVNFVVKAKGVKAKDIKNALGKAGIEVTSVLEVFREEEQQGKEEFHEWEKGGTSDQAS